MTLKFDIAKPGAYDPSCETYIYVYTHNCTVCIVICLLIIPTFSLKIFNMAPSMSKCSRPVKKISNQQTYNKKNMHGYF